MDIFLRARNLHLELPQDLQGTDDADAGGLGATLRPPTRRYNTVLSRIHFEARDGDRIGIVGLNGAGKTTLLRVLNGALPPTSGRVERQGTMQSLLNPMLGFHEHASLAENVVLRGTAMGLRYRQLQPKLEEILAFAGLQDRAAHRLHTLSAGQRMRLGFAISTAVQPDILLMDEWISAGDAAFLQRAQDRMRSRFNGSRIVVLASHSTSLLRLLCNKAIVLQEGRMRFFGPVEEALIDYREVVSAASAAMRRQLAEHDPMLFGDSVGLVERIQHAAASVMVDGWATDHRGGEAAVICVELDGSRHVFDSFDRVDRDDVRRHLGKRSGAFGFRLRVPARTQAQDIANRIRVSVGGSPDRLGPPLSMASGGLVSTVESVPTSTQKTA